MRRQSRTMSLVEAVTNVVVGYGLAVITQMLVFPRAPSSQSHPSQGATRCAG